MVVLVNACTIRSSTLYSVTADVSLFITQNGKSPVRKRPECPWIFLNGQSDHGMMGSSDEGSSGGRITRERTLTKLICSEGREADGRVAAEAEENTGVME